MERLRKENQRLRELLQLSNNVVKPETGPALPEPVHANANGSERSYDAKTKEVNGINHTSGKHALQEHPVNDLQANISADAADNPPTNQQAEESAGLVSSVASSIVNIGENVLDTGMKLLEQPVPHLLVDLPVVDPHLPMESPNTQSLHLASVEALDAEAQGVNVAETSPGSPVHIVEEEEHHPSADQGPQEDSAGYHSATSATSPPFDVDEALIFRAKENAARREGIQNVCPDFVHGMLQTHS